MRARFRRYARLIWAGALAVTLASWFSASIFGGERYRRRLEARLEQTLRRRVTFRRASFHLLPRPGFTLRDVQVWEDPAFGSEAFARADRVECALRWRSLWRGRLEIISLSLDRPSFNVVRNASGEWNVGNLLRKSGITSSPVQLSRVAGEPGELEFEANDARIDFKSGADKKPFAITSLHARLHFDPGRRSVSYALEGNPVRTDLLLPSPGPLELAGEWTPGSNFDGPLNATLRTQGSLLYDWVPLLTGRNPEIYGVLDSEIHLTGSLGQLGIEGEIRLSQLHRWEQIPPAESMPTTLDFRGRIDRLAGRVQVESLEASFAASHVHLSGAIDKISSTRELDLVVALERSRLEDLQVLGERLRGPRPPFRLTGRVDGLLTIQGPWAERRVDGSVRARDVHLTTPSGTFPVSAIDLSVDNNQLELAPFKLSLAPRVELAVEGGTHRATREGDPAAYELSLSAKAVPLRDLVEFGRAVGIGAVVDLDARGWATATFQLSGPAWPLGRPVLSGRADIRATRLFLPGLTEPLEIPRARIQVNGDQIIADPVVAVMGTSVFSGRLEHEGARNQPWKFDVRANHLSFEQGSQWFDALGERPTLALLSRIPGFGSLIGRRTAASKLFSSLNARGRFASPAVTYRAVLLEDFRGGIEISGRAVRVTGASFRAAGGRGQASALVDLNSSPARVTLDVRVADAGLERLAPHLPAALRQIRGSFLGNGHFETRGLTREELSHSLRGTATVRLERVLLGEFDPLDAFARKAGVGTFETPREEPRISVTVATLEVEERRVMAWLAPVEFSGAWVGLTGTYSFDGTSELDVRADFSRVKRRWLSLSSEASATVGPVELRLAGPLEKLVVTPEMQASRAAP